MTRRSMLAGTLALGLVALAFGPAARAADKANATGTWTWNFERNGETVEITLKLKQDGEKLTGTISRPNGDETEIKDGAVKGDEVTFKVVREINGESRTIKYQGTLSADAIKGKSEIEINGEARSRDWEAKRKSG